MLDMLTIEFYLLSKPVAPDRSYKKVCFQLPCKITIFFVECKNNRTFAIYKSFAKWIVYV